ncbi:hypothetical protein [Algoriphagus sp. NG3]|uniref:hypothetical protein n=1 Tax=Algoriphagus sp. NG3 TaxID=3097546 RepID=UPI002A80841A|nr:hypothetical protein [Algoriphagus sp. NG3]WPR77686.1 hypothetical protein SLW71_10060 [Algoriphagus sp. NG3]
MKALVLLLTFLSFTVVSYAQQTSRNLGSVDLAGNKGYVLKASVKNGKFTYTILDQKNPETEVDSFSLINNNSSNFTDLLKKTISEKKLKFISPEELEKYYFYFSNQNIFLEESESGSDSMEMIFNDSVAVFSYQHSNFTAIKKKDIYFLLNEIYPSKKIDFKEFTKNPFGYIKTNSQDIELFDTSFQAKAKNISYLKPRAYKFESLYKAISDEYYKTVSQDIKEKLISEFKNLSDINKLSDSINLLEKNYNQENSTLEKLSKELKEKSDKITELNLSASNRKSQIPKRLTNKIIQLTNTSSQADNTNTEAPEEERGNGTVSTLADDKDSIAAYQINQDTIIRLNNRKALLIDQINSHNEYKLPIDEPTTISTTSNSHENIKSFKSYLSNLESIKTAIDSLSKINQAIISLKSETGNILTKTEQIQSKKDILELDISSKKIDLETKKNNVNTKIKDQLRILVKTNKHQFNVKKVEFEINNGYLENIEVIGKATFFDFKDILQYDSTRKIPELQLKFISDFPIGISSKKDIERIGNYRLYSRFNNGMHYEMKLGNLISIVNEKLAVDRKDYSPKDGEHTFILPEQNNPTFKKSDTKEILQLKVFTDFVGINDENPNGLIQLEIDKEIPLYTKRIQRPYVWIPFRWAVLNQANIGVFNFFKPQFIYSKIENNNKHLLVKSFTTGTGNDAITKYGVSTLQLKQYEIFSVGADLNVVLYDIPGGKSTFLLNAGFRFGRTDLASNEEEPEVNDFPRGFTNTIQPSLEGLWRINGDERFGIEFSYKINWLRSDELFFEQKATTDKIDDFASFETSKENNTLQSFTLLAYLNVQKENPGRLFFRYRYNSEFSNFENNYAQLQLGYTTYLTRANK